MNIFFELHKDIPREGPGTNECTKHAYELLKNLPKKPKILDIGCGPGMQTLELAKQSSGSILAIDMHEPFLEILDQKLTEESLKSTVVTQKMDMSDLTVPDNSLDLIWSEGAIYIMGFEDGIRSWKEKLKENGYIAVSEISWLKEDIPDAPKKFWNDGYPDMKSVEENIKVIESTGMKHIAHFTLPENAWWDNYYTPLTERVEKLRVKYKDHSDATEMLDAFMEEVNLYKNYSSSYGYVFYIMQKQ